MTEDRSGAWGPWVAYSALRLLFFGAPLGIVYALSGNLIVATVVGAIIGLCLSIVFLGRRRSAVVEPLTTRRPSRIADEDIEDAAVDGQNASAAPRPKP